jgi:hypothetical protein
MKDRLIDVARQMEAHLANLDQAKLTNETRTLWEIANSNGAIKRVRYYLINALVKWEESVFYYILIFVSILITIFFPLFS